MTNAEQLINEMVEVYDPFANVSVGSFIGSVFDVDTNEWGSFEVNRVSANAIQGVFRSDSNNKPIKKYGSWDSSQLRWNVSSRK